MRQKRKRDPVAVILRLLLAATLAAAICYGSAAIEQAKRIFF